MLDVAKQQQSLRQEMLRKVEPIIDGTYWNLVFFKHSPQSQHESRDETSCLYSISEENDDWIAINPVNDGWIAMNSFREIKGTGVKDQKEGMVNVRVCVCVHVVVFVYVEWKAVNHPIITRGTQEAHQPTA